MTTAAVGQAGQKLTAARAAVRTAEKEFALAGMNAIDEAAQQRREAEARKPKPQSFRMSPRTAAQKLAYACGIPSAAAPWFEEIFARLDALEKDAAPPHLKGIEKRG